jgi:hypothetical protein
VKSSLLVFAHPAIEALNSSSSSIEVVMRTSIAFSSVLSTLLLAVNAGSIYPGKDLVVKTTSGTGKYNFLKNTTAIATATNYPSIWLHQ